MPPVLTAVTRRLDGEEEASFPVALAAVVPYMTCGQTAVQVQFPLLLESVPDSGRSPRAAAWWCKYQLFMDIDRMLQFGVYRELSVDPS